MDLKRDTGMQCPTYHDTGKVCTGCDQCDPAQEADRLRKELAVTKDRNVALEAKCALLSASLKQADARGDDDLLEVTRSVCAMAAHMRDMDDSRRAHFPSPLSECSPLLEAAQAACVKRGYTADGLWTEAVQASSQPASTEPSGVGGREAIPTWPERQKAAVAAGEKSAGFHDTYMAEEIVDLRAALAQVQAQPVATPERDLYTCIGKSGTYELIGRASAAGQLRDVLVSNDYPVYRDTESGLLFVRVGPDFDKRMQTIPAAPAQPADGVEGAQ